MESTNGAGESMRELRRKAEEIARTSARGLPIDLETLPLEEIRHLLHELSVHQIELEMQNEELRRTQVVLDALRARYFDLYDLAPVGYCILSLDGLILESNLTAAIQLGMPRSALLQQPITRFIFQEDQDLYYLNRKHFAETGIPFNCELRMLKHSGDLFWVHLTSSAARDWPEGPGQTSADPPLNRLVMTDVTARRKAEEEAAKLQAKLQQVKKLQTLGILAGGVAHDFNNLLAAIMGNANLGSLLAEPGSRLAAYFEAIERASLRASSLTSQLLAYAGKGKLSVTEVDLDIIVKEVDHVLSVSIPPGVEVRYDLADRLPFVKGDPTQIFQVIMNIVTNASEAIPKEHGGVVTLRTSSERIHESDLESSDWILPVAPGQYATLEVADTGVGMAPEIQALAFDPFFSTKFTGRGLGLAAVLGILGSHGGGIKIRSALGRGSSFKIFFPAMQGERSPVDAGAVAKLGEGRLLVVDGDPAIRALVGAMAGELGFSTLEASSGPEAVELFQSQHEDLSLVFLDLALSRLGDWRLFKEMRQIDASVPVVVTGAFDIPEELARIEGSGGFLRKPYRVAEFQKVLQRTLAESNPASS